MAEARTPDWVKSAVFYQIFPDRFARSRSVAKPTNLERWDYPPSQLGFKGGDLIGVVERLDYLRDLGVTALYFCPIFQSTANHRYHTHDFYQVDPVLGGNRAFTRLLDAAHRRGMRVVLDGVFNHASRGFYQFNHLLENGQASPYLDWFHVNGWPLHAYEGHRAPNYAAWWNMHALPKLNTRTPAVREFLLGVGQHWVEQGIDGWRLDVPSEIDDDEFWREFRRRVKGVNPDAYIVGEIWGDAQRWLRGDQFDAVMNYPITRACLGFFARETLDQNAALGTGYGHIDRLDGPAFAATVSNVLARYPSEIAHAQLNLLGSHDTPRFATLARRDGRAFRLALLFLMTFPGAPCIYYGDEIAMEGGRDPDCRRGFPWKDDYHTGPQAQWDEELLDHARRATALRHAHPVFSRGSFAVLQTGDDLVVYARRWQEQVAVVALNAGRSFVRLETPASSFAADGTRFQAIWGQEDVRVDNGVLHGAAIPPRSGLAWLGRV